MNTSRRHAAAVLLAAAAVSPAFAQAIGPDMSNPWMVGVQRYGTDAAGTTTAYAVGALTCSSGDMPAAVAPNSSVRPLIAQNMYRLSTVGAGAGAYQRFEHIGQSWAKRVSVPVSGSFGQCGVCQQAPAGFMGVGCADMYTTGFNGAQSLLGPRSFVNATTGVSLGGHGTSQGDSTTRGRIQVLTSSVVNQPASSRFFVETVHVLPDDATYVRPGQAVAVNAMNNAASQEIAINGGLANPTQLGATNQIVPAVEFWRQIDPGVVIVAADHDDTPNPRTPATTIRSRFHVAARVTPLPAGQWRYEYTVFNLNSDRSCYRVWMPMAGAATFTDFRFSAPRSHSGEPYGNEAWTASRAGNIMTTGTTVFEVNPNANAVRWGTMYSFGFTTNAPPRTDAELTLGLFKPAAAGASTAIFVPGLPLPGEPCNPDVTCDGSTDQADVACMINAVAGNGGCACQDADFNRDGNVDQDDVIAVIGVVAGGPCP